MPQSPRRCVLCQCITPHGMCRGCLESIPGIRYVNTGPTPHGWTFADVLGDRYWVNPRLVARTHLPGLWVERLVPDHGEAGVREEEEVDEERRRVKREKKKKKSVSALTKSTRGKPRPSSVDMSFLARMMRGPFMSARGSPSPPPPAGDKADDSMSDEDSDEKATKKKKKKGLSVFTSRRARPTSPGQGTGVARKSRTLVRVEDIGSIRFRRDASARSPRTPISLAAGRNARCRTPVAMLSRDTSPRRVEPSPAFSFRPLAASESPLSR